MEMKKNFFPKNRKGSHVDVVISFVAFVAFILVMILLLSPSLKTQNREETVFEFLKLEILENVSENLYSITLDLDSSESGNCIEIPNLLTDFGISKNVKIRNQDDEELSGVFTTSNNLQITKASSDDFFKIYYSPAFSSLSEGSGSCSALTEGTDYSFGVTTNNTYVFESRMNGLMEQYENYDFLKDNLGVPPGLEFGFGLIYNNGTTVETTPKDVLKNVYIRQVPIIYVDTNGEVSSGFLKILVW